MYCAINFCFRITSGTTVHSIFIYNRVPVYFFLILFSSISLNAQSPITLFQSLAGRYNYVITGASHRTQPNTINACAVTAGPVSATIPSLPAGSNIVAAYLYWVGSYSTAPGSTQTTPDYSLNFNGISVTAPLAGRFTGTFVFQGTNYDFFGGRADVTAFVNTGTTVYTVNGLSVNSGSPHCAVTAVVGGWALLVVYENTSTERLRVVNIFDGLQFYHQNLPPLTLNPTNFRTDTAPDGKITAITWEGEPTLGTGENITFRSQSAGSATTLFHTGTNPVGNQFNSTITSSSAPFGVLNTIPPPHHGLDLDTYDVSSLLIEDDLQATTVYQSGADLVMLTAQVVSIANKPVSDLTMNKTDNGIDFGIGECGKYTITITNNGPDPEFGPITVSDTLPAGLTFNSGSGPNWTCGAVGQNVTCTYTGPPIPVTGNTSFTLIPNILPTAPASVFNTATVSGSSFDNIAGNNTSSDTSTIVPGSDFSTSTKTVVDQNGGDPHNGDVLRYTITVSESQGVAATGVQVIDDLPAFVTNLSVVSIPPGTTDNSTGAGTGTNGNGFLDIQNISIPASGSVTIIFDVTVNGASHGDVISNTASIVKNCPLVFPSAPDITVQVPDLSTSTKTLLDQNGGDPHNGDILRYTITLTETAGADATGISVIDDIPAFVNTFTVINIPAGATDNSTGPGTGANGTGFLDVSTITVPASSSVTVVFDVTISGNHGDSIANTATITNPHGPGGTPSSPNVTILVPNVSTSTKSVVDLNGGNPKPGDVLRYTISLIESNGAAASGISVTDDIPQFVDSFTVISVPAGATDNSTGVGTGANGNGFLDVSNITIPASSSEDIVFDVTITGNDGDVISNSATVTNSNGPGAIPSAPDTTIFVQSDLSTSTKTVVDQNGGNPHNGDVLRYTITVIESGGVDALGINVTDDIPPFVNNFTVSSFPAGATDNSTGAGTGANGTGFLDISNVDILANTSVIIEFDVTISGSHADVIGNTAVINNPSGIGGTPSAPDITILVPDLSTSSKTVLDLNGGSVIPGDVLEYTITLFETNGADATGVSVTDTIPPFVNNFAVTSNPIGSTDNSTGAGTGANGTGFLDITNITVPSSSTVTITFEVSVVGPIGNTISNSATITNPNGPGATPNAPNLTIGNPPASGIKPLYLFDLNTTDPNGFNHGTPPYLSRTPPAAPQNNVTVDKSQPPRTWTMTPFSQAPLTFGAGFTIPVRLWVSKGGNGGGSVNRQLTVTLDTTGVTTLTIGTVTLNFLAPRRSTPIAVLFNIPVTAPPVNLAAGSQIRLTLQNTTPGGGNRRIRVFPIGTTSNSQVDLDSSTVINVDSVQFYDAAYPGGSIIAPANPNDSVFIRSVVSDPFGSFDIVGAAIDIIDPNTVTVVSAGAMAEVANSGAASKTYEYQYTIPALGPGGNWTALVTASEGTEGTITHTGVAVLFVGSADLVVIKSSLAVYDPVTLFTNPKRIPGGYVNYTIRVTNTGIGTTDNNSVVVRDNLAPESDLFVGDLGGSPAGSPVIFVDGSGPEVSGLSLIFSGLGVVGNGIDFSNDPGPPYTYNYDPTPNIDANGFDSNITSFRINPSGTMNGASGGNNPYFEVIYRVRIR